MDERWQDVAWGAVVGKLRLGIRLSGAGGDTSHQLEIVVNNVSAETARLVETHVLQEHVLEVRDHEGRPVPMTDAGERERAAVEAYYGGQRRMVVNLAPGETHKVEPTIELEAWFQLGTPGTYTVQVIRREWKGEAGALTSGRVTFTCSRPL